MNCKSPLLFDPPRAYTDAGQSSTCISSICTPPSLSNSASANVNIVLAQIILDFVLDVSRTTQCTSTGDRCTSSVKGLANFNCSVVIGSTATSPTLILLVGQYLRDGFLTPVARTDFSWTVIRYDAPLSLRRMRHSGGAIRIC